MLTRVVQERRTFSADLDMCELGERSRPSPAWTVRGVSISRSHIRVSSRRMCYVGAQVGVAVHLVDDRPCVLHGVVEFCEYDADGRYAIEIALVAARDDRVKLALREWFQTRKQA
ncbi:MAG: hypothetical protein AAGF47_11000 [Planctomycetota bacterium]